MMRSLAHQIKNDEFFLFSKSNAFRSEFLYEHEDAILQLTGFTGSYGFLCVFKDESVLFVDGRYKDQASIETNCKVMNIHELHPYVALKKVKRMLINTMNHTIFEISKFKDIEVQHFEFLKREKIYSKIIKIPGHFKKIDLDNVLICDPEIVSWALNIRSDPFLYNPSVRAFSYFSHNNIYVFTDLDFKEIESDKDYLHITWHPFDYIKEFLKDKKFKTDPSNTPYAFKNLNIEMTTNSLLKEKSIKNDYEIEASKKAHKLESKAWMNLYSFIVKNKDNLTEIEIEKKLEELRKLEKSYKGPSFRTICGAGKNATVIHYHAKGNCKIENLLLIDAGGQYLFEEAGATTDATRTYAITEPTNDQKIKFTLVLKGHIALATAIFKRGTTGAELDILARQFLWRDFYDYPHGTGHGVGSFLNVHEGPCGISKNSKTALEEGMIVSNEPGYYKDFGIRIENLMYVKKTNHADFLTFEVLTLIPIDTSLIEYSILSDFEKEWIRSYHNKISELNF